MNFIKKNGSGILICFIIALASFFLGKQFHIIGGPVFSILSGMIIAIFWKDKGHFQAGIKFASKKILQLAVILLGFGMNLAVVIQTGKESLPIILCTIATSLTVAFILQKALKLDKNTATLIGVGSSICGGSAIAATSPVIEAEDNEVAQAISIIFLVDVLAVLLYPTLGKFLGFDTTSGTAFGIFAGTAVNDTSSVTAVASTWDAIWQLGNATVDKAVIVKLTRTLAIIPITLVLAYIRGLKAQHESANKVSIKKIFPYFIIYFVLASIITTVLIEFGVSASVFNPIKQLSKFFIIMAMAGIGLNSNIIKLIKTGAKPVLLGLCCSASIATVSIILQHLLHLW